LKKTIDLNQIADYYNIQELFADHSSRNAPEPTKNAEEVEEEA